MKTASQKWINTILFNLDGVIIDSGQAIINAWKTTAEEYGYTLTPQQIDKYIIGASHQYTLGNIFAHHSEEMRQSIHQKVERREAEAHCELIKGVKPLLSELQRLPIKLGIVTSSWPDKIYNVLDQHNLHLFNCIISRHDVVRDKPDPMPYLKAMEMLNSKPELTLVFEDSDNGIFSALSAGTHCLAINNSGNRDVTSVKDFTELSLNKDDFSYGILGTHSGIKINRH